MAQADGLKRQAVKARASAGSTPTAAGCICRSPSAVIARGSIAIRIRKRLRTMGLGALSATVSLKQARIAHAEAKALRDAGVDPIIARGAARQVAASALVGRSMPARRYIEAQKAKWKTANHVDQIRQRLRDYVYPIIGHLPIADIKAAEARAGAGADLDNEEPDRGPRAAVHGRRHQLGDPRGHPHRRSPIRSRSSGCKFALPLGIHEVTSHPSLPFEQAPPFLAELRQQEGVKARAMELVMLTAVRDRRHLRRRQGAFRADEVEPRRPGRARCGPSPTPRWAGRMSCR